MVVGPSVTNFPASHFQEGAVESRRSGSRPAALYGRTQPAATHRRAGRTSCPENEPRRRTRTRARRTMRMPSWISTRSRRSRRAIGATRPWSVRATSRFVTAATRSVSSDGRMGGRRPSGSGRASRCPTLGRQARWPRRRSCPSPSFPRFSSRSSRRRKPPRAA